MITRHRLSAERRRRPLTISVDPATFAQLHQLSSMTTTHWPLGRIVELALQLAEQDLLRAAASREVIFLLEPEDAP